MIEEARKNHHGLSGVPLKDLATTLDELNYRLLPLLPNEDSDLVRALVRAIAAHESLSTNDEVKAALSADLSSGDDFGALGDLLNSFGLPEPAEAAFKVAASIDFQNVSLKDPLGGPFNGQKYRQAMFRQLLSCIDFSAIVETGSFRGSTTEFMADATTAPLFSCELSERHFHFARRRLASLRNVKLLCKDSRAFLREVLASGELGRGSVFFYLDAHWGGDLPLWDELDIILGHPIESVVMIDDFRVPGDLGFGYDDYGPRKQLSVAELRANVTSHPDLFFPSYTSSVETGFKRGATVLAHHRLSDVIDESVPSLARTDWDRALRLDAAIVETTAS